LLQRVRQQISERRARAREAGGSSGSRGVRRGVLGDDAARSSGRARKAPLKMGQEEEVGSLVIDIMCQRHIHVYEWCAVIDHMYWVSPLTHGDDAARSSGRARKAPLKMGQEEEVGLSLYKIFVYVEAVVHESTILSFSPLTCIAHPGAIRLHDY